MATSIQMDQGSITAPGKPYPLLRFRFPTNCKWKITKEVIVKLAQYQALIPCATTVDTATHMVVAGSRMALGDSLGEQNETFVNRLKKKYPGTTYSKIPIEGNDPSIAQFWSFSNEKERSVVLIAICAQTIFYLQHISKVGHSNLDFHTILKVLQETTIQENPYAPTLYIRDMVDNQNTSDSL